jgi:hypothetical protein
MSSIKLESNASGTGIFTIASPNSNTNRTLTLPDNTGTILTGSSAITASQLPAGSVLQVVQTIKTDTFSTTSGSLTDITGMSVSITPSSASNKILVQYSLGLVQPSSPAVFGVALLRGSTVIGAGATAGSRRLVSSSGIFEGDRGSGQVFTFLDSPATTSSTTYKLQIYINGGLTIYVNRSATDLDNTTYNRTASTITVMEIAA